MLNYQRVSNVRSSFRRLSRVKLKTQISLVNKPTKLRKISSLPAKSTRYPLVMTNSLQLKMAQSKVREFSQSKHVIPISLWFSYDFQIFLWFSRGSNQVVMWPGRFPAGIVSFCEMRKMTIFITYNYVYNTCIQYIYIYYTYINIYLFICVCVKCIYIYIYVSRMNMYL